MSSIEKAVARLSGQADDAAARTNAERAAHHASVSTEASPDPSAVRDAVRSLLNQATD